MRKLAISFALLLVLQGLGCGDDDDDGSNGGGAAGADSGAAGGGGVGGVDGGPAGAGGSGGQGGSGGIEPMDAGLDGGQPAPTLADLQGTWQGPCSLQEGDYRKVTLVFSGSTANMLLGFYGSSATCEDEVLMMDMEMEVSVGAPVALVPGAYRLPIQVAAVTAVMNSAQAVDYANAEKLFGYSNWKVGVPKDVAGRDFFPDVADAGAGGNPPPEVGDQTEFLFRLNDARDQLQISDLQGSGAALGSDIYYKQ